MCEFLESLHIIIHYHRSRIENLGDKNNRSGQNMIDHVHCIFIPTARDAQDQMKFITRGNLNAIILYKDGAYMTDWMSICHVRYH